MRTNSFSGSLLMTQPNAIDEEAKDILVSSWHFYKASFYEMVRIFWLPFVVLAILKVFYLASLEEMIKLNVNIEEMMKSKAHLEKMFRSNLLLLAQLMITPWVNAVAILFFYAKTNDHQIKVGLLYQTALKYWPRLLVIFFMVGGIGYVGVVLFRIGLWPLIVPALWLVMKFVLSDMIYVLEKPTIVNAFKMSFDQTKNKLGLLILCMVSVGLPIILVKLLLLSVLQSFGNSGLSYFVIDLASSFVFLITNIIIYRIYMLTMDNRTILET